MVNFSSISSVLVILFRKSEITGNFPGYVLVFELSS